jgi:hypothetical protein
MVAAVNFLRLKIGKFIKAMRAKKAYQAKLSRFPTKKVRAANAILNRKFGLDMMASLSEYDFKRMFRMSRQDFGDLARKIALKLSFSVAQAERSSGSAITITTRLACTIRWLAGGSHYDISKLFGVSTQNFFHERGILWTTMAAINDSFTIGLSLMTDDLERASNGFAKCCKDRVHGCVLAVDGWICKTRKPHTDEVRGNVSAYRNRKGCWGICILAGCDADLSFKMFSTQCSGSTNDVIAWELSALKATLDEGLLPSKYFFIGDEAFNNCPQFLVPYSGQGIGSEKDAFNYHLSSMRQCIERAFGVLTKRWGVFWRPLSCAYDRWSLVCTVAAKLHNYLIERNDAVPEEVHPSSLQPDDVWQVIDNGSDMDPEFKKAAIGDRRKRIAEQLREAGYTRPPFAACNSRA